MKKLFIILLFCGYLLADVSADTEDFCQIIYDKFLICKNSTTLVSVNDINTDKKTQSLYIDETNLTTIAPKAFKDLNISDLIIKFKNDYLSFEKESFSGLKNLQSLQIINGVVVVVPDLFFYIKNVDQLSMRIDGHKQSLESVGKELLNLKNIIISDSNFGFINVSTFDSYPSGLIQLTFSSKNNITKILRKSFMIFSQLKSLTFHNNNLKYIEPGSFFGLSSLENLKITNENVTVIYDNTFRDLKSLKNLIISHNQIHDIHDEAFNGLNLTLLDLKNNKLKIIKNKMFFGLKCAVLDLSMNSIISIESSSFKNLICQTMFISNLINHEDNRLYWGLKNETKIVSTLNVK